MVGRILPNVPSCKKLRTPAHSGKIMFVWLHRLFVGCCSLLADAHCFFELNKSNEQLFWNLQHVDHMMLSVFDIQCFIILCQQTFVRHQGNVVKCLLDSSPHV
jgi:hypothetical protein